jgi:hypothetical protein
MIYPMKFQGALRCHPFRESSPLDHSTAEICLNFFLLQLKILDLEKIDFGNAEHWS